MIEGVGVQYAESVTWRCRAACGLWGALVVTAGPTHVHGSAFAALSLSVSPAPPPALTALLLACSFWSFWGGQLSDQVGSGLRAID